MELVPALLVFTFWSLPPGSQQPGFSAFFPSYAQIKHLDPSWIEKYFRKDTDGKYQVISEIRQRVCFNHLNILDMGKTPIGNMDVIVCQNVLIYYQRERRLQIVNWSIDWHLEES